MSEQTTEVPAPPAGHESLEGLAARVDKLTGLVEKVLGGAHADATSTTQERLDAPGHVGELVRQELDKIAQAEAAAAAADADKAERAALAEQVKAMRERPPETPLPKRTRAVWGDR